MKVCLGLCFVLAVGAWGSENVGPWDLAALYEVPAWEETDLAAKEGMTGILYGSLPYKGQPVQVFAYYSAPAGEPPEQGWPAMVCVHGGGGTAFDRWVRIWNEHGYAAISMDLEGHIPLKAKGGAGRRATPQPGPARRGVFAGYDEPIDQQWYYHAVAQVIAGHSLIRSLPEVDPDRTGLTGISWGGNLTSTVMGVDTRFKCAIPVYGCGFLSGSDGHQGRAIRDGAHAAFVDQHYDGSAYFANVTYPTFWVNGTNDFHFSLPAVQQSSQAVQGPATLRYGLGMGHGHIFQVSEYYAFADSILRGGESLPACGKPEAEQAHAACDVSGRVASARLIYTLDSAAIWPDKEWKPAPAVFANSQVTADLPAGTYAFFFELTDEQGRVVTSEFLELTGPGPEASRGKVSTGQASAARSETRAGAVDFASFFEAAAKEADGVWIVVADAFEGEISQAVQEIVVVEDPAGQAGVAHWYDQVASGGGALQITNSKTVQHAYQPCLGRWFKGEQTIRSGTLELSFDLLVPKDGGHPLSVLIRDYTAEPAIELVAAACTWQGVRVNGKSNGVAPNAWVHYSFSLLVGEAARTGTLTTVDAQFGARNHAFSANGGRVNAVSWVGLCLGGKTDATVYLDNLVIKVVE